MSGVVVRIADARETAWVHSRNGTMALPRPANTPIRAAGLSGPTIIGDIDASPRHAPGGRPPLTS